MRLHVLSIAALLAVSLLVLGLSRLVLPACGVETAFPDWLRFCPVARAAPDPDLLAALEDERASLVSRIALQERELAAMRCDPAQPIAPAEAVNPDRWEDGDLSLLEGCWALDSDYATQDQTSGEVTEYEEWSVCFAPGADGQGRQVMRSADGAVCEGELSAGFAADGRLVLTEPEDLQCSDGYFIYRRETTCALADDGRLQCGSVQPEVGGRGSVVMRPAE